MPEILDRLILKLYEVTLGASLSLPTKNIISDRCDTPVWNIVFETEWIGFTVKNLS
jgi:hypothetical protein